MSSSNFEKIGDIIKCKLILEDGSEFTIPMRNDGYIFATGLCKIVKKQVGGWLRLNETKELIKTLESDKLIHLSQLVEVYKGNTSKYDQGTWIHPDLGIQLAQWCSPSFSLQVSKWIKELILTDKVELGKEKSNEELQEELNKIKNQLEEQIKSNVELQKKTEEYMIEIEKKTEENQVLANKFVRLQKRETFPDNNVVYIVTNDELEKERIFLLGKAVDMKNRLTSYNKSMEHKVVYYKSFKNMYQMKVAEMMVLYKLNQYKTKEKKERFLLPENQDISLFTKVIDDSYNWFQNIENIVVDTYVSLIIEKTKSKKIKFESNTVYMLTSKFHNRTYIIGKSSDLNSRLSGYNKGIEHDVIYTKKCKNKHQMDIIELMILYKLDDFRERANRDRFILPEQNDINIFTNVFDDAVKWFDDIDDNLIIFKDEETKKQERNENKKVYRELNKEHLSNLNKTWLEKNKDIMKVKKKNYRETHKEQVSNGKKDWYKRNKENVTERIKNNYVKNKEQKIAKVKEYAEKNKEKIKQQQSITITCECGSIYRKYSWKKHFETEKHVNYLNKNNTSTCNPIHDDILDVAETLNI